MHAHPLCAECERNGRVSEATELDHVDHRKPKTAGQDVDESNWQMLCAPCHKAKTVRDLGYRVKERIGVDGYPIHAE